MSDNLKNFVEEAKKVSDYYWTFAEEADKLVKGPNSIIGMEWWDGGDDIDYINSAILGFKEYGEVCKNKEDYFENLLNSKALTDNSQGDWASKLNRLVELFGKLSEDDINNLWKEFPDYFDENPDDWDDEDSSYNENDRKAFEEKVLKEMKSLNLPKDNRTWLDRHDDLDLGEIYPEMLNLGYFIYTGSDRLSNEANEVAIKLEDLLRNEGSNDIKVVLDKIKSQNLPVKFFLGKDLDDNYGKIKLRYDPTKYNKNNSIEAEEAVGQSGEVTPEIEKAAYDWVDKQFAEDSDLYDEDYNFNFEEYDKRKETSGYPMDLLNWIDDCLQQMDDVGYEYEVFTSLFGHYPGEGKWTPEGDYEDYRDEEGDIVYSADEDFKPGDVIEKEMFEALGGKSSIESNSSIKGKDKILDLIEQTLNEDPQYEAIKTPNGITVRKGDDEISFGVGIELVPQFKITDNVGEVILQGFGKEDLAIEAIKAIKEYLK